MNRNTGNKSTVYFVDENQYIVIDNVTNTIVQTSDLNDKDWKVDSGIKNIRSTK
ncbi:colicin E5-related ribonuclease [Campylobacter concisus]|uniref:colicin E5-related ribonuclease n=1 Tax=Campylobacter concisus TaxID=199 RepID=UPI001CB83394